MASIRFLWAQLWAIFTLWEIMSGGASIPLSLFTLFWADTKTQKWSLAAMTFIAMYFLIWSLGKRIIQAQRLNMKVICNGGPGTIKKTMFSNQHPVAYYRAILEVNGCGDVKDCSAHLVSVKCDGEEIEIGEVLQLTFASHRGLKDLKPGIPAFLDLLAVSKANKLYIAVEDLKLPNSISHEQIFPRQGRYLLEIRVSGPPATALIFEFIWDGEWDHSKVRLISQNVIKPLRLNLDKAI